MVDRLSTTLMFKMLGQQITDQQSNIYSVSKQINSGIKFSSASDDPVGIIGAINTGGRITANDQAIRDRNTAMSDLQAAEAGVVTMVDILNRVKEIAIRGSNGATSNDERDIMGDEIRTLGETFIQLANTKNGDKYVFSGQQSSIKTLRLQNGAAFSSAIYKNGQDNEKQREVGGITSSTSIEHGLISTAASAKLESGIVNPTAPATGDLDFVIDDGNGNLTSFTASITAGDDLATMISTINTAFNAAGGTGSLAHEDPAGYLKLDTALITGSAANENARITLSNTSSSEITNGLYLKKQSSFGRNNGVMHTLAALETALNSNDDTALQALIDDIDFNINQFNSTLSSIGLLTSQAERLNSTADDLDIKLQADLSIQQDVDMIDANLKLSSAQSALQTAIQTASSFFSQSLTNFIG